MASEWAASYEHAYGRMMDSIVVRFDGAVFWAWCAGLSYVGMLGVLVEKLVRQQRLRLSGNFSYSICTVYTVMYFNNPNLMFFFVSVMTFVVAHLIVMAFLKRIVPEIVSFFYEVYNA